MLGIAAAVAALTSCESERSTGDVRAAATAAPPSAAPAVTATASVPGPLGRQPMAAAGGVAILASAARAQALVAGTVSQPTRIDVSGWRAELRVDTVMLGPLVLGDTVTVAWEELSASRAVRFADGERVLLVLDPLPSQSLWRKRFPVQERAKPVLVVAAAGEAFLLRPDGATLNALGHYFALTSSARAEAPGSRRLAEIARVAHPTIAREALGILDAAPERVAALGEDGAASLLATASNPTRDPALRAAALRLAGRYRLPGTGETALALIAPESPVRVDAYRALAALPNGLTPAQADDLLVDADPDLRVVGIEVADGRITRERVVALRDDPAPAVRLAAGRALLARDDGGIAAVIGLLDDPDASVRAGVAESIGTRGADAVAPLRAVVDQGSERAALAAVYGLSRAGGPGGRALAAIAESHTNESIRAFARLGLGEAPSSHKH
jgi:hypothetical protein